MQCSTIIRVLQYKYLIALYMLHYPLSPTHLGVVYLEVYVHSIGVMHVEKVKRCNIQSTHKLLNLKYWRMVTSIGHLWIWVIHARMIRSGSCDSPIWECSINCALTLFGWCSKDMWELIYQGVLRLPYARTKWWLTGYFSLKITHCATIFVWLDLWYQRT